MIETLSINKKQYNITCSHERADDFLVIYDCEDNGIKYEAIGIFDLSDKKYEKKLFKNLVALFKYIGRSNLSVPKLITIDKVNQVILREKVEGKNVLQMLGESDLEESVYQQLFFLFGCAKKMGLNLEYNPKHYLYVENRLIYIGFTFDEYSEKKDLINNGIMLWYYTSEVVPELEKIGFKRDPKRLKPRGEQNKEIVLSVYKYYNL